MPFHKIFDKLHDCCGETLVETLAAILIAALSVALLFTCVTAADRINRQAQDADKVYFNSLSEAEKQTTPASVPGTPKVKVEEAVTHSTADIDIKLYGKDSVSGKSSVYSYK